MEVLLTLGRRRQEDFLIERVLFHSSALGLTLTKKLPLFQAMDTTFTPFSSPTSILSLSTYIQLTNQASPPCS